MTEISEKEVRAAGDVLLGRVNAPEQEIYRAARAALKAAALARAEANAEGGEHTDADGYPYEYAHPAPQPSGTVEVKPLEWSGRNADGTIHIAHVVPTEYWAWEIAGFGYWSWGSLVGREVHGGLEAAKAAAQADYERRILSALTAGKPEQVVPSGKHWFAVQSPTGVHVGLWDDGKIAYGVAAEYGSDYTIMELVELPAAPTAGGGDA